MFDFNAEPHPTTTYPVDPTSPLATSAGAVAADEDVAEAEKGALFVGLHNFSLLLIAVANKETICRATLGQWVLPVPVAPMIAGVASNSCQVSGSLLQAPAPPLSLSPAQLFGKNEKCIK